MLFDPPQKFKEFIALLRVRTRIVLIVLHFVLLFNRKYCRKNPILSVDNPSSFTVDSLVFCLLKLKFPYSYTPYTYKTKMYLA